MLCTVCLIYAKDFQLNAREKWKKIALILLKSWYHHFVRRTHNLIEFFVYSHIVCLSNETKRNDNNYRDIVCINTFRNKNTKIIFSLKCNFFFLFSFTFFILYSLTFDQNFRDTRNKSVMPLHTSASFNVFDVNYEAAMREKKRKRDVAVAWNSWYVGIHKVKAKKETK